MARLVNREYGRFYSTGFARHHYQAEYVNPHCRNWRPNCCACCEISSRESDRLSALSTGVAPFYPINWPAPLKRVQL